MKKNNGSRQLWFWTLLPWMYCGVFIALAVLATVALRVHGFLIGGYVGRILAAGLSGIVMLLLSAGFRHRTFEREASLLSADITRLHREVYIIGMIAYAISSVMGIACYFHWTEAELP